MSVIFGKRLKELRLEKGLSQQEVANHLSVSKMTISAWETNKQEPCIDNIVELANFLDITTDYLLGAKNEYK